MCQNSWYTDVRALSLQGQIQPFPFLPLNNVGLLQNDFYDIFLNYQDCLGWKGVRK